MAIIAISGKINSGKDLTGKIIQILTSFPNMSTERVLEHIDKDLANNVFEIKKFADALKDMVCLLIGCTREQLEDAVFKNTELGEEWWYWENSFGKRINYLDNITYGSKESLSRKLIKPTPRLLLQLLGTNCGRNIIHPSIWLNALMNIYNRVLTNEDLLRLKSIWKNINTRCTNSNYIKSHKYKDIGISNEFLSFEDFVIWSKYNGYTSELTLDRKDGNKNYSKDNCRWVTTALQGLNKKQYDNSKSKYKGVSSAYNNKTNPYLAQIQFKGIKENLGFYKTQEEAKKVYDKRFLELLKEEESITKKKQYQFPNWIITDLRFENELKAVKDRGGISIRVNRYPKMISSATSPNDIKDIPFNINNPIHKNLWEGECAIQHESETALDTATFDYVIDNNGTIKELIEKVREILIKENII